MWRDHQEKRSFVVDFVWVSKAYQSTTINKKVLSMKPDILEHYQPNTPEPYTYDLLNLTPSHLAWINVAVEKMGLGKHSNPEMYNEILQLTSSYWKSYPHKESSK